MKRVIVACLKVMPCCLYLLVGSPSFSEPSTDVVKVNPLRDVYYGDLHLHTSYSFDAYLFGAAVEPDKAYRFGRGEIVNYLGQPGQRREPLDFLAVTDHSENIGVFNELEDPNSPISQSEVGKALRSDLAPFTASDGTRRTLEFWQPPIWKYVLDYLVGPRNLLPQHLRTTSQSAWAREIEAANHNYKPGKFTTFIAYEWSSFGSTATLNTLHRNVIFKGNAAPFPFTSFDSKRPEDLWAWMETIRDRGYETLAIPHNSNESNGLMYDWLDSNGRAIDQAYASRRQANEPLSEISQSKGTSEAHPLLSPEDEFAGFEIVEEPDSRNAGSYLRDALGRGLVLKDRLGVNPYKYGFVGASDLHSGLSLSAQADYAGEYGVAKMGGGRPTKAQAAGILEGGKIDNLYRKTTSGKLTGVWAESNTRDSIFNALRRRETFATSGTRVSVRFFGGWKYEESLLRNRQWVATAYSTGVPMGGDLPAKPIAASRPTFVISAIKDPNGASLDRVQIVKIWDDAGKQMQRVFDVAWSGPRTLDPKSGKLPPVGNTVDLHTGLYTNSIGSSNLTAVWKDPQFDPRFSTAYYVRVLEIPTPRWSTLLALEHGLPLPKDVPATEQQRAWSSPIWYSASDLSGGSRR